MNLSLSLRSFRLHLLCVVCVCSWTGEAGEAIEFNNMPDEHDELFSGLVAGGTGVSGWQVSEPYINLWIFHQPLTYETSYGQAMACGVAFKQRNNRFNAKVFGLGPGWESSWLSYVEYTLDASNPPKATVGTNYVALGGARNYVGDGVTKEIKSSSTMTILTNGSGVLTGFQVSFPSGAKNIFGYLFQVSANENYAFLSQRIDPVGHTNLFAYDTIGNVVRLRTMVDSDNRTNTIAYDATFTAQIKEVTGPYGTKAGFGYDGSGRLTTITNAGGLVDSFTYDSQNLITNLATVYGTTSFKTTTNSFGGYNLGGTNQVNRSVLVTDPDGGKQLFIYRDSSSKLNPGSAIDLIPSSYPGGEVPITWPLLNTFDNSVMDARNSFSWNQKQYAGLNASFRSSGDFNDLTTNDYNIAVLRHWLRGYTNAALVSQSISLDRDASPDGTTQGGQKTWFDYAGKVSNAWTRGTNASPLFVAWVVPGGTTNYTYTERNKWEHPTRIVDTYTTGGSVSYRTNNFTFSSDGIDLIQSLGPSNELLSSNAYNGFHQVVTNFNAVNDKTVYTYDSGHRLTGVQWPTGLVTTNYYFTSGLHIGWLSQTIDYETSLGNAYRTNSFAYTNGLVYTSTDPRGLVVTNTWDNLRRRTSIATSAGAIANQYANLDLIQTVTPSGSITNRFVYDSMQRLLRAVDGRNFTNHIGYRQGLINSATNALQQTNGFTYDFGGRRLTTTFADATTVTNRFNLLGQMTNVTDAAGVAVTNWFNNQGLLRASSNALGQVFSATYDIRDRATTVVAANGQNVAISYDNLSRVLTRTYPDGGIEKYQHSARGVVAYTNQLGLVTRYGYDALGRRLAETNANGEVTRYVYSPAGDLITLTDAKNHSTQWAYDQFGRVTNVVSATGASILRFKYDQDGRLTNRWSAAKGDTFYTLDKSGNITQITYPSSPNVSYSYDALNRLTNMLDAVGTSDFSYTSFGALSAENGPWPSDSIGYTYYANHLRSSLNLVQPNASLWVTAYTYDTANRLQTLTAPPGAFTYSYQGASLIKKLTLPNGAYITNTFDTVGRVTTNTLYNSAHSILNSHSYTNNLGNQRTRHTRTDGRYVDYTYDDIGQLKGAVGKEPGGGSTRLHESFGFAYDAAGNLNYRTNNALVQTFSVDSLDQLSTVSRTGTLTVAGMTTTTSATSVTVADNGNGPASATLYGDGTFARTGVGLVNGNNTFTAVAQDSSSRLDTNTITVNLPLSVSYTYDSNGNLASDGLRSFTYDDENRLASVSVAGSWYTSFVHDGLNRLRLRREYLWQNSIWVQSGETRYVYDGNLVIQERDRNNLPTVTYTRGLDASAVSLSGAGGIGGLLARTENSLLMVQSAHAHAYYHADGAGNVSALLSDQQLLVARYIYDPFGNQIVKSGRLADANVYRFSSKEYHDRSGLISFGLRFYDPNLQRWLNRDPVGADKGHNLHGFTGNNPANALDPWGTFTLAEIPALESIYSNVAAFLHPGLIGSKKPPEIQPPQTEPPRPLVPPPALNPHAMVRNLTGSLADLSIDVPLFAVAAASWGMGVGFELIREPGAQRLYRQADDVFAVMGLLARAGYYDPYDPVAQAAGYLGIFLAPQAALVRPVGRYAVAAKSELITVRTYTGTAGREGITSSGVLRADTWVTLPGEIPSRAGHLQIEKLLEIQPGRGANFLEFQVPASNLRVPANGPRTSGGALQFQLNESVPIDPSTFRRPPGRPGG